MRLKMNPVGIIGALVAVGIVVSRYMDFGGADSSSPTNATVVGSTSNATAHWERISGFDDTSAFFGAIAIHPADPDLMFVAGRPFGIRRSRDGGKTWTAVNHGIDSTIGRRDVGVNMGSLRFDPRDPKVIYFGSEVFGVFKSTDQGDTWVPSSTGIPPYGRVAGGEPTYWRNIVCLAFPTDRTKHVFAGTDDGLLVSKDGGDHWSTNLNGLPNPRGGKPGGATISGIDFERGNPSRMYVIFYTNPGVGFPGGVYRSTDSGESWTPANNGLDTTDFEPHEAQLRKNNGYAIATHPTESGVVLVGTMVGIYRSSDAATSWQKVSDLKGAEAFVFDPRDPNAVYAGGRGFLSRSGDGGRSWQPFHDGIAPNKGAETFNVYDLVVASNGTVYAVTDGGVYTLPAK
jgi:photosystem II stability/assembly factor-like uncharacterized protein